MLLFNSARPVLGQKLGLLLTTAEVDDLRESALLCVLTSELDRRETNILIIFKRSLHLHVSPTSHLILIRYFVTRPMRSSRRLTAIRARYLYLISFSRSRLPRRPQRADRRAVGTHHARGAAVLGVPVGAQLPTVAFVKQLPSQIVSVVAAVEARALAPVPRRRRRERHGVPELH